MAKGTNDVILRDRLQFTLDGGGDLPVVYGRLDLSSYVNPVEKKGLAIKEFYVQPRIQPDPETGEVAAALTNTGSFVNGSGLIPFPASADQFAALKIFGTTRAYQHAYDVGIGSPDVFHLETFTQANNKYIDPASGAAVSFLSEHMVWSPRDLHPDGYVLVSDILVGVASDNLTAYADTVMELDILVIAQPVTIGAKQLTEMLTQAQDI